jgi:hypothetical protein
VPDGWEQALGVVASTFHLPDVWEIDIEELLFWVDRAVELNKRRG